MPFVGSDPLDKRDGKELECDDPLFTGPGWEMFTSCKRKPWWAFFIKLGTIWACPRCGRQYRLRRVPPHSSGDGWRYWDQYNRHDVGSLGED